MYFLVSMDVYKAVISRRSIRRFQQKPIKLELLKMFVNAARLAPSAANLQPLEFLVVNKKELCNKVFETISWAGYIKPKWTPSPQERPAAYIVMLIKNAENKWYLRDVSLSSENIVIAAEGERIGSCILCNIDRDKIRQILKIPEKIIIDSIIALGYKDEKSVIEDFKDNVEYWRDENNIMHVPKRKLDDVVHINNY